ncbi:MAG: dihydrofolate reductase family protein [Cytophagales bacterium]|nr:dihydrofolate reductase family protein [Cytophagales bacterium]
MKCSVFIATSLDGYIAKPDDSVDWLQRAGNQEADMAGNAGMGLLEYLATVDCMIIGRKLMEVLSSFELAPDQWPYGDIKIYALSNSIKEAPDNLKDRVEMYSGDINVLVSRLEDDGYKHAYIDGGNTIQGFINQELINEVTITIAPILLGEGKRLFGKTSKDINLKSAKVESYPNDFIQVNYTVDYL